jgi:type IV fimbrial biogenesis protein FimT
VDLCRLIQIKQVHSLPKNSTACPVISLAYLKPSARNIGFSYKTSMNIKNKRGFTLIELLVTVAVLIVLLLVGVPEYRRMTENNRQVAAINTIIGDLNLARTEAVKQGRAVTLCGSTDGATCNTANWESGWIVFLDLDREGDVDGTDILISRNTGLPAGLTLRTVEFDTLGTFAAGSIIQYLPNGQLRDVDGDNDADGTFQLCEQTGDETLARVANVTNLGRVAIGKDTDSDKIREDVEGADITCP